MLSSPSIPLESFQIYSTGSSSGSLPSSSSLRDVRLNQTQALTRFWSDIVFSHPETLKRISVHRMSKLISMDAIEGICRTCRGLEELFVVMEPGSLHQLASRCLTLAPNLRYVHVNYPLQAQLQTPSQGADAEEQDSDPDSDIIESEFLPVLSPQDALAVIQYCSDALVLFGCNTRVWKVQRQVEIDEEGKPVGVGRELVRYDGQDIPEAFLVVRT
ncbi:hypothetical protein VKT23_019622 [Stygiomarasmius scandens]|uniref:Uncharacterized protein n=1 Tax=Marasmiellus scandens TaxID=2682957 RepID=A0ABR1IN16_9AGAR